MPYGVVGFRTWEALSSTLPSPAIWADSLGYEAVDLGVGYHVLSDFKTGSTNLVQSLNSGTITYDTNYDSVIKLTTAAVNTGNGISIFNKPIGSTALYSQAKLKFEAIVATGTGAGTAESMFVGLAGYSAASTTGGVISTSSSTAGSNSLVPASLIGFWMHGDTPSTFDIVYQNGSTQSTVLVNALNSSVFTTSSTQPQYSGAGTATGVLPPATPYPLAASTFVKLGVQFDGQTNWQFFVNGQQVWKLSAIGTTDNSTSYGGNISFAAPGSTQATMDVAYYRNGWHLAQ